MRGAVERARSLDGVHASPAAGGPDGRRPGEVGRAHRLIARFDAGHHATSVVWRDDDVAGTAAGASPCADRNRRSLRALATTETLENAIASPAISGLSKPAAASGRAATL